MKINLEDNEAAIIVTSEGQCRMISIGEEDDQAKPCDILALAIMSAAKDEDIMTTLLDRIDKRLVEPEDKNNVEAE